MVSFVEAVFRRLTIAAGTGAGGRRTVDVIANPILGIPVIVMAFVLSWKHRGRTDNGWRWLPS
jgi:hypothetical protein